MSTAQSSDSIEAAIAQTLERIGFSELRPKQKLAVRTFVEGNDVFVCLPTGSGKSLCYWLLPRVFEAIRQGVNSTVIVVSPLEALMKDQEHSLQLRGIRATKLGLSDTDHEKMESIKQCYYEVVFVSPERLLTDSEMRDMLHSPLYKEHLVGVVIDEAHCVKKWGEKFRKEFANLGEIRSLIPSNVQLMALTATATKQSRQAICHTLGMKKPVVVSQSPNKPNIFYKVHSKSGSLEETLAPLVEELRNERNLMDRVLIFCQKYDDVTHIYHFFLSRLGKEALHPVGAPNLVKFRLVDMYTACTHPAVKDAIVTYFTRADSPLRILVATIAFGMGLDCPNIRRVIHWGPPSNIESYLQETGRSGRDNLPAKAIMYFSKSDLKAQHIEENMKQYCSNTTVCRRRIILKEFDFEDEHTVSQENECVCMCCDICRVRCKCQNK